MRVRTMTEILVKIKKNCLACQLLINRLKQWGLTYRTVESDESVPRVKVGETELLPPITTKELRKFFKRMSMMP